MNYLHIVILDDTEECFVSYTQMELREQVSASLTLRGINALNDEEWAECVTGEVTCDREIDCLPFGVIYYYKTEARLVGHLDGVGIKE